MIAKTLTELTQWARAVEMLWLFLDYDGTLADFAPTPDHIEPDAKVIDLLDRLSKRHATRVTILSGRRLQHIQQLVPVQGIYLGGSYGIEIFQPNGETILRLKLPEIRKTLDVIKPQWQKLIDGQEGFYLEDKGWTLALHARFAQEDIAQELISTAQKIAQEIASPSQFKILGGHKFLEVAPIQANKRDSIAYFLDQYPFDGASLIYIGDDDKDEAAFPVIQAHSGIALKVRQASQAAQPSAADAFLDSPQSTLAWLEGLL